jgi:succinate dehydrogenase hydrophobic anchor subunit
VIASEPSGDSPIPVDTMALADRVTGVVSILLNTCTVSVRLKSEIVHKLSSEYYTLCFNKLSAHPFWNVHIYRLSFVWAAWDKNVL